MEHESDNTSISTRWKRRREEEEEEGDDGVDMEEMSLYKNETK